MELVLCKACDGGHDAGADGVGAGAGGERGGDHAVFAELLLRLGFGGIVGLGHAVGGDEEAVPRARG